MYRNIRNISANLFGTRTSILITILYALLLALLIPKVVRWAFIDASVGGTDASACSGDGACWTFVKVYLGQFIYGRYSVESRWRPDLVMLLLVLTFSLLGIRRFRTIGLVLLLFPLPIAAIVLLLGGVFGLPFVPTPLWGGLMVNLLLAFGAIIGSLLAGLGLAFGRRSKIEFIRLCSVAYIECVRGVPLVAVLFCAAVMLPLFLPPSVTIDGIWRAMLALSLFYAAYIAEVFRGGLQAVAAGQREAATALGMTRLQFVLLIELPLAFRAILPALTGQVIEVFKDTSLVMLVGQSDILGNAVAAASNPEWMRYSLESFVVVSAFFVIFCWIIAVFGRYMERVTAFGHR